MLTLAACGTSEQAASTAAVVDSTVAPSTAAPSTEASRVTETSVTETVAENATTGVSEPVVNSAAAAKVVRLARTQADVQTFEIAQDDLLLTGEYADVASLYGELDDATTGHDHG